MDDFFKQLNKAKSFIEFEKDRKDAVRGNLLHFIRGSKVVMENAVVRLSMQRSSLIFKFMPIFAVIVIVALVGGGTSFAAEGTLPGDLLYPLKVHFNEEVRAVLALSVESKARWDAERAERRLDEATELAFEGKINEKTRMELEDRFEEFADRAEARLAQIGAKGKVTAVADLASNFETALRVHEEVLNRIEARASGTVESEIGILRVRVHARLGDIEDVRTHAELKIESADHGSEALAAAEGKVSAAENVIASARVYIENRTEKLGAQATVDAEARLKIAEDLVVQAKAKIFAGAYGEAFNLGNQAIRVAQEARGLVEAGIHLNVGVGSGVGASTTIFRGRDRERENATTSGKVHSSSGLDVRGGVKVNISL